MTETISVKALKKQLAAAIAMVLVAAIALGSSTYAWFVSNNRVTATTSSIYAQSNSAYLLISNKKDGNTTAAPGTIAATNTESSVALYPATWTNGTGVKYNGGTNESAKWLFATGYAKDPTKPNINDDGLFAIKSSATSNPSAEGTYGAAVESDYAYLNSFYVGTGKYDGSFTNLKVTGVTVQANDAYQAPTGTDIKTLETAIRVLVVCGNEWTVFSKNGIESGSHKTETNADGIIRTDAFGKSAENSGTSVGDVQVDVYIYYEGSDASVFSNNLENINIDGLNATVTFEATPEEFGK